MLIAIILNIDTGTGNLTITGTGFGTSNGSVKIGKTSAEIFSWADKSIKVRMPTKPAGSYPLKIHVPSVGFAKTKYDSESTKPLFSSSSD